MKICDAGERRCDEYLRRRLLEGSAIGCLVLGVVTMNLRLFPASGAAAGERALRELVRRGRKPVVLIVDESHDLHPKTLVGLKRLMEVVADSGGTLAIVLAGHPKLRNDLRRRTMEEIGSQIAGPISAGCLVLAPSKAFPSQP